MVGVMGIRHVTVCWLTGPCHALRIRIMPLEPVGVATWTRILGALDLEMWQIDANSLCSIIIKWSYFNFRVRCILELYLQSFALRHVSARPLYKKNRLFSTCSRMSCGECQVWFSICSNTDPIDIAWYTPCWFAAKVPKFVCHEAQGIWRVHTSWWGLHTRGKVIHPSIQPWATLTCLLVCTCVLYTLCG